MDLETRFEILEKVGAGSYATVYRARDKELGREVAVKQIHQQYLEDPRTLDRYWAEAQLLASLHHPNIVTIFDIVRERGWLIMELMQGSLKDRVAGRQMDLRSLRAALGHCLRALKYLHERGIIHGDIKPGNMMIDHRKRVKLGDFGLARRVSDEDGSLLKGTAKYIAPEMVSDEFGEVGPQSDLYSLGFSAYDLMCGGEHFEDLFPGLSAFGRDKQAAWMMWHAAPDRRLPEISRVLEGVPDDLARVVQKLVEKDPDKRCQSADEALSDLNIDVKLIKAGGETGEHELAAGPVEQPDRKRRALLIGAFAVSLLLSLAMLFLPSGPPEHSGAASTSLGVVREVNSETSTIEYEHPQTGVPDELVLTGKPRIRLLSIGEPEQLILLKKIEPGDWIEIERTADASGKATVNLTVARPATSEGTVKSIDSGGRRITVAVSAGKVRDDLVMQVPDRAKLSLNGQPTSLRELALDDRVSVRHVLDPAGKQGHIASDVSVLRRMEMSAFVDSVDDEQNALHVSFGRGSAKKQTIPFAEDCEIVLKSGEALDRSELRPGDRLTITADTQVHRIVVTREDLQASGTVASVDEAARTLEITLSDGSKRNFTVHDTCALTLNIEPAALGDLRPRIDTVTVGYSEAADGSFQAGSIDVHRGVQHDRWAIVIGTQSYTDRSLTPLPHATADAQLVYESLVKRYAMDRDWAVRLLDENRDEAHREIERRLGAIGSTAQIIVYVTGHAYIGPDDVVYLALKDFRFDDMPATGLPLDWLVAQLEACKSTDKLLLLDVVHDGTGRDLERQPSVPDLLYRLKTPIRTVGVIGSSSAGQRGQSLPDGKRGAFAQFVALGFAGAADADKDLHVTGDEMAAYLIAQFASAALPEGRQQTPFRLGSGAPSKE